MSFWKKHFPLIIAIIVSLLAGRALLTPAHFHTHDDLQVFRLNEYITCIDDGQLPCRWSSELGKGYGYPYFNFYPPAIYAIPAVIHFATGSSLVLSLNIFAYLTFPFAALGMYLLVKELGKSRIAAATASILYTLAPYHALNIFVRGVYAENLAWAILPFLLYFSYQLIVSHKSFFKLTLTTSLLLLTHNISAMLMLPLLTVWVIFLAFLHKSPKSFLRYIYSLILSFGLASFFFLPALLEKSLVQTDSMIFGYYAYFNHFVSLKQIFLSRYWGFGGSVYGVELDEMSFAIGYALSLGTLILTPLAVLGKKLSRLQKFLGLFLPLAGLFVLSLMHNRSTFIWGLFPLMQYIQFPWRLLGIASTLLIAGIGYNLTQVSRKVMFIISTILLIISCVSVLQYFQPESYDSSIDQDYISGVYKGEQQTAHIYDYLPATAHSVPDEVADSPVFQLSDDLTITTHSKTSNTYDLSYSLQLEQEIILALYYYPGWVAELDGQPIRITPDEKYGFVSFISPPGEHNLKLVFANTPSRTMSNYLSLASLIAFITLVLMYNKRDGKK